MGGTGWADPPSAYQGAQVWGTDLSGDGAYANGVVDAVLTIIFYILD